MAGKGLTPDLLANLRALASQAIGTENGTALTNGPLRKCKAVCTITVNGGTLTLKLQQSSDNSTWYDVPGSGFLDETDGAVMDGIGAFEVYVDLTERYVRSVGVVATGAVTYSVHLAVRD